MNIQTIKLQHTNPSLGPYEKITTVFLSITEQHIKRMNEFLHQSQINNTASLYDYLNAIKDKNEELINHVLNNTPKRELNQGEKISNLFFYFEDGQVVELADVYRKFELTHFYADFTKYMVENGIIDQDESDEKPFF
ncbi:hypothetical protein ACE193_06300 [Bernardetia sp. OM2101]|uniref:hypothetical protein n=1 Tax=Bernardetia sp. OM2101 TaxID=3344876 RepID=UPI0035CEE0B2